MPEGELVSSNAEDDARVWELKRHIRAYRVAHSISGDIFMMSDELVDEMMAGISDDLAIDSMDVLEAMLDYEDDEGDGDGSVREPRRPLPSSGAGALALGLEVEAYNPAADPLIITVREVAYGMRARGEDLIVGREVEVTTPTPDMPEYWAL